MNPALVLVGFVLQGGLSEEEFGRLHRELRLPRTGVWSIPWKISLAEAREQAAKEKKPLYVYMEGQGNNPLGVPGPSGVAIRFSAFEDREFVTLVSTRFVPVAMGRGYYEGQPLGKEAFCRRILEQSSYVGHYAFTPEGDLLGSGGSDPGERMKAFQTALDRYRPPAVTPRFESLGTEYPAPPEGGLAVFVTSKVLDGRYEEKTYENKLDRDYHERLNRAFRTSMGVDRLWVRKDETQALARGVLPDSLKRRIGLYHLVDLTFGIGGFWNDACVRKLELSLSRGRLTGSVHLESPRGFIGYQAELLGFVEAEAGRVRRFDLVAKGSYWGYLGCVDSAEGQKDPHNRAPMGKYTLAVAFTLVDGKDGDVGRIPPMAGFRNLEAYLR